jgi:septal ring-binding cell division protein DamX/type II secretory pathway predicted ATPase ExeA
MTVTKNNQVLSEQLIAHFDLNADPFHDDASVFFEGAQREHNLETLRHMSTFGDMVLLLTGEKGAGKTTLLDRFVQTCAEDLNIYTADLLGVDSKEKSQSIIHRFIQAVGLSRVHGETTRQSFSRLLQHLEDRFKKDGQRNVLVFDSADALPKKELQFYFSYFSQLPKESGVVAVFSGAPNLLQLARLSHIEGDDEWLHQIQLKPLGAAETLEYLQLRMEAAGFQGLLELSDSQVQHLVDIGKGLPGRVNRLFSSVVLEPGTLKLPSQSRLRVPKQVFVGLALLFIGSFLLVAHQYGLLDSIANDSAHSEDLYKETVSVQSSKKDKSDILLEQRAERLKMLDKALSESLVGAEEAPKIQKLKDKMSSGVYVGESVVKPESQQELVKDISVKKQVEAEDQQTRSSEQKISMPEKTEPKNNKSETKVVEKPVVVSEKAFLKDKAWVEAQNMNAYSAQILGSYNEQTAIEFAERVSKTASSIYYLETFHRGKPWFVVFYGVFQDKAEAQKAISESPKVIKGQKPWIRRFDGILSSYPK